VCKYMLAAAINCIFLLYAFKIVLKYRYIEKIDEFRTGEYKRLKLIGRWTGMPIFTFQGARVRDLFVLGDIQNLISRLKD
jgi:hypothetical protein